MWTNQFLRRRSDNIYSYFELRFAGGFSQENPFFFTLFHALSRSTLAECAFACNNGQIWYYKSLPEDGYSAIKWSFDAGIE
jgi:hypothetical protein